MMLYLLIAIVAALLWIGIELHKFKRGAGHIVWLLEDFDRRFERWEGEPTRKMLEEAFRSAQKRREQSE